MKNNVLTRFEENSFFDKRRLKNTFEYINTKRVVKFYFNLRKHIQNKKRRI